MRDRALLFAALVVLAGPALAQATGPAIPPPPRGYGTAAAEIVVDGAGVLDAESIRRINALAFAVKAGSGGELAVVTLPDLAGRDVGDIALRIGREWGVGTNAAIGERARNAGVVILLVPRETSQDGRGWISIQVGQGAEGFITDGQSGDIRREATPLLSRGEYGPALTLVTARVAERYAGEFGFSLDSTIVPPQARAPATRTRGVPPFVFLILFFIIISVISRVSRRGGRGRRGGGIDAGDLLIAMLLSGRGRGGGWGGGGFGGGGFGGGGFGGFGGGGGFSGGGSSGSF